MDIPVHHLRGRPAHEALHGLRRDIFIDSEGSCSGMPARVRGKAARSCLFQCIVVEIVEGHFVHRVQLAFRGAGEHVGQYRQDRIGQQHAALFSCLRFQADADDLFLLQINHFSGQLAHLAGHHAGVDHDERDGGVDISSLVRAPQRCLLLLSERLSSFLLELGQLKQRGQGGVCKAIHGGELVQVGEQNAHVSRRVVGGAGYAQQALQLRDGYGVDGAAGELSELIERDPVGGLLAGGQLVPFPLRKAP